jgi:hypothetical protein
MPSFTVVSVTAVIAVNGSDSKLLRLQGLVRRAFPEPKKGCYTTPEPHCTGRARYPDRTSRRRRLSAA